MLLAEDHWGIALDPETQSSVSSTSVCLLRRLIRIARRLACLGAALIILAVGISPTVQQTIVVKTRSTPTNQLASIPRARSFMGGILEEMNSVWGPSKLDVRPTGMVGLLYSGMYRNSTEPGQAVVDVVPDCPTNDCTYPEFESLAVCSACVDVAHSMNRTCLTEPSSKPESTASNVTQCTFSLSNGLQINQTTLNDDTLAVSAILPPIEPFDTGSMLQTTVLNASSSSGNISAEARKCSLSWCVKTYESKTVNGSLVEREVRSRAGWEWLRSDHERGQWAIDTSLKDNRNVSAFAVSKLASVKISNWLLYKCTLSNSKYLKVQSTESEDWFRFWEDRTGNFTADDFRTVSHLRDTIKIIQLLGYKVVFSNIAKALTTYVRTEGSDDKRMTCSPSSRMILSDLGPIEPMKGIAYTLEVYIEIQWPWLILLGSILGCTILFLVLTIHESAKHKIAAWKSEPLALMYHGLEVSKDEDQRLDRVGDMHEQGKWTMVQLRETESGH